MRRTLLVATVLTGALTLGGCNQARGSVGDRQQLILQATVREVVGADPPAEGDALPVVYIVPIGEQTLAATVQVEVVEGLSDTADVRFADSRDEAIASDTEELTVKHDGVLLLVGDIAESGNRIDLPVEVYVSDADRTSAVFTVRRAGSTWSVTSTSVVEATGT